MLKQFFAAVAGGLMIAIGGCVYLNALGTMTNSYFPFGIAVGAFFFAVALVCICIKGYGLFTGRVGYLPDNFTGKEAAGLGMTLLGNAVATFLIGLLVAALMKDGMSAVARSIVADKLETDLLLVLLRAVLCGVLMYLAVSIYKEKGTLAGILFCVPSFIIAGFEHSIADMFYIAAAGFLNPEYLTKYQLPVYSPILFLLVVIVGNAIGGMLLPLLHRLMKDDEAPEMEVELVEVAEDAAASTDEVAE